MLDEIECLSSEEKENNMKLYAHLSSGKSWAQAFSVDVRFSSPHCGDVEMRKSMNANSRNRMDLRIIQKQA